MRHDTKAALPKDKIRNTFALFAVLSVVFIGALILGSSPSSRWTIFRDAMLFYPLFVILLGYSVLSAVKWFGKFRSAR